MRKTLITRREQIIISTVDLINEMGIKELSIKEIAKRENVTEASLYKHFESKEEILLGVLDYYEKYDRYIHNTLNSNAQSAKENTLTYFKLYATL
jgi:AcrR family transcriptional regulator